MRTSGETMELQRQNKTRTVQAAQVGTPANAGSMAGKAPASGPTVRGQHDILIVTIVMVLMLAYAWAQRNEGHLTAETGIGYYLGIVGSVMLLLLLLYPLRKRVSAMRWLGPIPQWFRLHMLLGVVGPALVLLHSNFTLGSLNSQVALFSMLIVAGSGYVGRFLYRHVHLGLSGRKRTVYEMKNAVKAQWPELQELRAGRAQILGEMEAYELHHLKEDGALTATAAASVVGRFLRRRLRRRLLAFSGSTGPGGVAGTKPNQRQIRRSIDAYLAAVETAQTFILYERLFALWHFLHLPLFFILFAAAILHVIAVHLY